MVDRWGEWRKIMKALCGDISSKEGPSRVKTPRWWFIPTWPRKGRAGQTNNSKVS